MDREDIFVIYGKKPKAMARELLERAGVADEIPEGASIGLKPNLVVSKSAESGATTSPEIVEALIEYLKEHGFGDITIMESSWVGDDTRRAYRVCGYEEISKRYGVPLLDLKRDKAIFHEAGGLKIEYCDTPFRVDYLINLPVLKGHCQTAMTCALKNMKGCITDREKRRFHTLGLHKPIACLNKVRAADLVLVDGMRGDLDFEEGGNPVQMNRMLLCKDSVLIDAYVAQIMGYDLEEIPYITLAAELGVGSLDVESANIVEMNRDESGVSLTSSRRARALAKYIDESDACSACYGSLIHALARLEDRGMLRGIRGKIHIGQGFKGKEPGGMGVGVCAKGCEKCVPGCPPKAIDIVRMLEESISSGGKR
ncbi:DUF362 domain-containing protein [Oscillospiraceae bacterium NSJ-54]|uniref:DUF362 domain-containing protein n=1 Tax=Zongyangia hominis TaxID=2763677 RepID=A0A926I9Q8_9FIRM|nr:DUF362 domain-containing protein [Zongyangia hominis]MBC8569416.1 DUF362 domain-containing protein [Zongyangia hominis]